MGRLKHTWVQAPQDGGEFNSRASKEGWSEVTFRCSVCGVCGHVMHKDGPLPSMPEEVLNEETGLLVDPLGECEEQLVDAVHAF